MNFDKIFNLTAGVLFHVYNSIMFDIKFMFIIVSCLIYKPTLYAGFLVSVHRMVM